FDRDGRKLTDAEEEEIEGFLAADGQGGGSIDYVSDAGERYVAHVVEHFGSELSGLRVAVDCANGAMTDFAPRVFEQLGAEVTAVGTDPNGTNINVGCGATDLSLLSRVVQEASLDLGVAFDGDGDRLLAVDERGEPVDGDQILAIL